MKTSVRAVLAVVSAVMLMFGMMFSASASSGVGTYASGVDSGINFDMGTAPDRGDYDDGIFGDISYFISSILFYISFPVRFILALFKWIIDFVVYIVQNFGQVGAFFSSLFSFMPSPIPEIFIFLIMTSAVVIVIKMVRG